MLNYYIVVFKNTHDAMSAEKKLNELSYKFRIMPTPTVITMSCGICVRIEDKNYIETILKDKIIEYKNIYFKQENGYVAIDNAQ